MVKLEWPNPFQEDDPNFYVMGTTSINGILCLYQKRSGTKAIVLWNPTTQESKVVPPNPVDFVPPNQGRDFKLIGFGYDRVRDDYKVIRYRRFYHLSANYYDLRGPPQWEIYSLRSNSWRTLDCDCSALPAWMGYSDRLYLDGMCHWPGGIEEFNDYLVSFDLSNEVFYTTRMPLDRPPSQQPWRYLLLLYESVAVITNPRYTTNFYISILGQVGVKESWTRLFVLESLPCIIRPLGIGKKGNILFVKCTSDSELVQFDLCTYMLEDLGVKGAKDWFEIVHYKESFVPIGGINN